MRESERVGFWIDWLVGEVTLSGSVRQPKNLLHGNVEIIEIPTEQTITWQTNEGTNE